MSTFAIQFDRPDRKYRPGDVINIQVNLTTAGETGFRSIYVRFRGNSEVKWTESRQVTRNGKSHTEHDHYHSSESYFTYYQTLAGVQGGPKTHLPPGNYVYNVSYQLPRQLPMNFEGTWGHIRYDFKVNMEIPWGFDAKETYTFDVLPHMDLNEFPELLNPVKAEAAKTFGCCCWESDPLQVFNVLPKRGYAPGEPVLCSLEMKNNSDVKISSAEVALYEKVSYIARTPHSKTRTDKRRLWAHVFSEEAVLPLQNKIFSTQFILDPAMGLKTFGSCGIITVEYYIKSDAIVSGCHSNLDNHTTITIGTIPFINMPNNMLPHVPLAPMIDMPIMPSAPADLASMPPGIVCEQPLPSYNDAVLKPSGGLSIGWAVRPTEESPPPTFEEIQNKKA